MVFREISVQVIVGINYLVYGYMVMLLEEMWVMLAEDLV